MFSIAAINDPDSRSQWQPLAPTTEAQEFQLTQIYQEALLQVQAGEYVKAQNLLESILQDPLVASAELDCNVSSNHMVHLRFLTLKNLANVYTHQGSMFYERAIRCYLQAVEMDATDIVVWNQLGTLACAFGSLNIARMAFEQGLSCSPKNWNCMEKLLEVLIAIGDDMACLSVSKTLLKSWPSHARASLVKNVIEEQARVPFEAFGIDKLQPNHIGLSFPKKRKVVNSQDITECRKKRKCDHVDVHLPEASWSALINSLLDIVKSKLSSNSSSNYEFTEVTITNDLVTNQKVKFFLRGTEMGVSGFSESETYQSLSSDGKGTNSAYITPDKSSKDCCDANKEKTMSINEDSKELLLNGNSNEKNSNTKEREVLTDEEPPQERRSSRLERLRTRRYEREESDTEKYKEQVKHLREALSHYIVCDVGYSECLSATYSPRESKRCSMLKLDDSTVLQFLQNCSGNNGFYDVVDMVLEETAATGLSYHKALYGLLDLERLTRYSNKGRSPPCSLFLAELAFDSIASCSDDSKATHLVDDVTYHLCKVVETVASSVPSPFFLNGGSVDRLPKSFSHLLVSNEPILAFGRISGHTPVNYSSENNMEVEKLTGDENEKILYNVSQKMKSYSGLSIGWSFWVRFHWLSGHLSIFEGDRRKACTYFEKCVSILSTKNGAGGPVILPYCKANKEISLEIAQHELRLLSVETLVKETSTKMLDSGKYSELITLLSPVVLCSNDRCFVQTGLKSKDCVTETSIELNALDILITACGKVDPKDFTNLLKCHKRRLEIFCNASGIAEEITPASIENASVNLHISGNVASEQDNEDGKANYWKKRVSEEVKLISRCASEIKEFEESGNLKALNLPATVLSNLQVLVLNVMCHLMKAIVSSKSSGFNPIEQLESSHYIDAALAFCKLQHLDAAIGVKKQVDLLALMHELLAEHGLCCAGKDCEGGEGAFLKLVIKHLLALEIKLKANISSMNSPDKNCFENESEPIDVLEDPAASQKYSEKEPLSSAISDQHVLLEECNHDNSRHSGVGDIEQRHMKELNDEATNEIDTDVEKRKNDLGIDNALSQSFFCLYGLNLKCGLDTTCENDLAIHENTSRGDYQTKEQCADVFKYLLPYAKVSSRAGLVKLRKVLREIRKHFYQPPNEVLNGNSVDSFLDDPDFDEESLRSMVTSEENIKSIIEYVFAGSTNHSQDRLDERDMQMYVLRIVRGKSVDLTNDPSSEVYRDLYYILAQAEEMSATDKYNTFVLQEEGEDFVQQNANLFIYDLLYNPLRFESWYKLASIYDEEVDLMLNDGSKHVNVVEWKKKGDYNRRVEVSRRRIRRCALMSLALSKTSEQQSQVHELLALVYYDSLQNVVPIYDQRHCVRLRDSTWTNYCQNSLAHFEKAFADKPDWSHLLYLGKLSEKLGHPHEKALSYYSKAASLNISAVDPVYRIHASRMKLLYTCGKHHSRAIKVVASYCFSYSIREKVDAILAPATNDLCEGLYKPENVCTVIEVPNLETSPEVIGEQQLEEAWNLLFSDCIAALEVCVEGELKHFHKARYMLAQGFYSRGEPNDLEKAKEYLSFCFKSSRSAFTFNMWEIDGAVKKGRRKTPGVGSSKKGLELGLPESSRKFITCVRKYILLYLELCEKTGDFYTLERAYASIRNDKRFSTCLEDIAPVALRRFIQTLGTVISHSEIQDPNRNSSSQQLLEKMFYVYLDHINMWPAEFSGIPEFRNPSADDFSETVFYSFIHRYLHSLEIDNKIDTLEMINEKLRKRLKSQKMSYIHNNQVYKHAAVAWCRLLLINLASITPVPVDSCLQDSLGLVSENPTDNAKDLVVDIQTGEFLNSFLEDTNLQRALEVKLLPVLSCIRNIFVTKVAAGNEERAATVLRRAFTFYKESSCGTLPAGVNLYVLPTNIHYFGPFPPKPDSELAPIVEVLDLSIPRKLLVWAYTLVYGRYYPISVVVKHCEDSTKAISLLPSPLPSHPQV